jgi:uncharacterized membrane protein
MKKSLLDHQHLMDYTFYGILAGIFYSITVWLYVYDQEFREARLMYIGAGFFAFIMILYLAKLVGEDNSKKNAKEIVYAGHLAVLSGIIVSVTVCSFLCFIYKPEAFHVSLSSSHQSAASLFDVFVPAILMNLLAGSFISFLIAYAMKWNYSAKEKSISL